MDRLLPEKMRPNILNDTSDFSHKFIYTPDVVFEWSLEKIFEISDSTKILNGSDITNLIMNWDVGEHWSVQGLELILSD